MTNFVQKASLFKFGIRFAQFFLKPLFTESATEREVNAVNSENDKNVSTDAWRLHQLEKATCDLSHDFAKFGTGIRVISFAILTGIVLMGKNIVLNSIFAC